MSDSAGAAEITVNEIRHGDCVAGLQSLPPGCVDLVFADPPFNIGYDYDVYDDRRERDHYLDWSRQWIAGVHRALRPTGTFWLAIGDEYAAELKVLSQELGFHCRSWVVWYYTFGVNCVRKFSRSHAHLFHFVKDPENFTFRSDAPENRLPSARQLVYGDRRANPKGRLPDDTWMLRPQDMASCFTAEEDTWYFPRVAGTFYERAGFHGCQMPEQLLGRIIRMSSEADELVVDPFSGSGSTLVVAKKLGRRCLGFDLSADYVARGSQRLAETRRGDPLDGAPEPTLSAPATGEGRTLAGVKSNVRAAMPKQTRDASRPLFAAQVEAEERAEQALHESLERTVLHAYAETHAGHSLDRVVADPELHAAFVERCRAAGVPGDSRSWTLRLLDLRRAGRLTDFPLTQVTPFSWSNADDWSFASELALAKVLADGCPNIDEMLAEPNDVATFDALAAELAPGASRFDLRWTALKLLDQAELSRVRSTAFAPPRFGRSATYDELVGEALPAAPGVYLVSSSAGEPLFAGQTLDQCRRHARQFATPELASLWRPATLREELRFQYFTIEGGPEELLAYLSLLVRTLGPRYNLPSLGRA